MSHLRVLALALLAGQLLLRILELELHAGQLSLSLSCLDGSGISTFAGAGLQGLQLRLCSAQTLLRALQTRLQLLVLLCVPL